MPSRFQTYCKHVLSTTRLSSVCPVGGGGLVQLEHVGKSITKDWTQPVRRQGKASGEIVVIHVGPVGDIARTDGTEWAGASEWDH